jgi:hypothetical protein
MSRVRGRSLSAQPQEEPEGIAPVKARILVIFIACLLIPGSFFLAGARFTPYRAFLLIAFVPLGVSFLRGAAGRITNVDLLVILYGSWIGLSMIVHIGFERIDYVIIQVVEAVCGYLVGRVLVRDAADYRLFFRCFLWGLLIILPFGILEMLTKINLVSEIASKAFEPFPQAVHPPRLGLYRAQTSFEHPIHFGMFCSLAFANAFYIFLSERFRQFFWSGVAFLSTFTALSSAPLLAVILQAMMITWDRLLKAVPSKWLILVGIGVSILSVLQLGTPNGAVGFLIDNFTLNPASGEYRLMTLEYTIGSVAERPFFGVGPGGDVGLPWWHTGSIDNFWLEAAVNNGLPTTLFLFGAMVLHLGRVMLATGLDETAMNYRAGHFIAVAGLIFILATVALWGSTNVMIMAYIGAGAWIYAPKDVTNARPRRSRASPGPGRPARPQTPAQEAPPTRPRPGGSAPQTARDRSGVRGSTGRYGGGQG